MKTFESLSSSMSYIYVMMNVMAKKQTTRIVVENSFDGDGLLSSRTKVP